MLLKVISALVTTCIIGTYAQYHGDYHHEPAHHAWQPYTFGYEINDGYGNEQMREEKGDSYGNKKGSYGFTDAHGIYRLVEYIADEHGFRATIKTNEPGTKSEDSADVHIHSAQDHHPTPHHPAPLHAAHSYAHPAHHHPVHHPAPHHAAYHHPAPHHPYHHGGHHGHHEGHHPHGYHHLPYAQAYHRPTYLPAPASYHDYVKASASNTHEDTHKAAVVVPAVQHPTQYEPQHHSHVAPVAAPHVAAVVPHDSPNHWPYTSRSIYSSS